jgi:hypothetical protein
LKDSKLNWKCVTKLKKLLEKASLMLLANFLKSRWEAYNSHLQSLFLNKLYHLRLHQIHSLAGNKITMELNRMTCLRALATSLNRALM